MSLIKIGLLREGKVPPDKRVPLTPEQCKLVIGQYKNVEIVIQPSEVRAISNEEYESKGIKLQEDLSDCDILMGVKEVNVSDLIPNNKFLFFSHTIKKQSYNRGLLQSILDNKIQLIDYEALSNSERKRIIGFGRFAGIVGAYNGVYAYGKKTGLYDLKRVRDCFDRKEMETELQKVKLNKNVKLVLTGFGKVGYGAREVIDLVAIKEVSPEEFLSDNFEEPVFTHLETADYYLPKDGKEFNKDDFYKNGTNYISTLGNYVSDADIYMACHFWSKHSPNLLTQEDLQAAKHLKVVADISCDIAGPIASTLRPSNIETPLYGYNPSTGLEDDWKKEGNLVVMAVDNLPCELPKEASEDFGSQLIKNILPHLLGADIEGIIERGSETNIDGKLTNGFSYLQDYVEGKSY
jgi:saccharopine dehydrogenase (NAD+, L-lysine-forming)